MNNKTTTIYHPETKELSGVITEEGNPVEFKSSVFGCDDWFKTFDEAKAEILKELKYEYSGARSRDIANDRDYARQESIACGNY